SMRVSGQDKIDGGDVFVLSAIRFDNKRERLYFDVENGLLRRRISYMSTIVATIPQQTDFEDCREVEGLKLQTFNLTIVFKICLLWNGGDDCEVEGLKLPFMITVSSVDRGNHKRKLQT